VRGRLAQNWHVVAALDGDVQPDAADRVGDLVTLSGTGYLAGPGHQHGEGQAAADDDLFDVEELDLLAGQHFEERRRHTWLVDT
jgi:hypothetical protein